MQTKTYTPEFRAEAVKLLLAQGLSLEEAAQRIAMPKGTLANRVSTAKRGNADGCGKNFVDHKHLVELRLPFVTRCFRNRIQQATEK